MLRERRRDKWQIRVHETRARRLLGHRQAALREHALDLVVVPSELDGDGAHRPLLGVVEAEDLRALLLGDRAVASDHQETSRRSRQSRSSRAPLEAFARSDATGEDA